MIWLLAPALAAGVTTYVVAMVTRPPGTCKLRVSVPREHLVPGCELTVDVFIQALAGPIEIAALRLFLVRQPGYLVSSYAVPEGLLEELDVVLQTVELEAPSRLESGETRQVQGNLRLPGSVDAQHLPAVEARLWTDLKQPPVRARRLLKLE